MTRMRVSCASSPVRAMCMAVVGMDYSCSADAHEGGTVGIEVARGGEKLGPDVEGALILDHLVHHLRAADIRLLERAGGHLRVDVGRQYAAVDGAEQAIDALVDLGAV